MAPRYACVLVISTGMIVVTGLLATWMSGFDQSKIKVKSFINLSINNSDAAQTSVEALTRNGGAPNSPKAQTINNFPGTASVKMISGTSVVSEASSATAIDEAPRQTPAERAAVSPAGGTVTTFESTGELKTAIAPTTKQADTLETTETTSDETITCTQTIESSDVETFTNSPQKTPGPESRSSIIQTDVTVLEKETDISITEAKQETTSFVQTITSANTKIANPITEPMTDRVIHFITDILKTSENKPTTEARPVITFRTTATITKTKADLTEGNSAASTVIKRLKTAGTETPKIETSKTTTVRPQESTKAKKPSHAPTTINGTSGINLITITQTATSTQEKTKRLSTGGTRITKLNVLRTIAKTIQPKRKTTKLFKKISRPHKPLSPCKGKCLSKSTTKSTAVRRARVKTPIVYNKTLYSAITMGCILIICAILALIVFIKDFTMR